MRVKMLTNVAGTPSYRSGEVIDLKPEVAKAWIDEGYATAARDESPAAERAVRS